MKNLSSIFRQKRKENKRKLIKTVAIFERFHEGGGEEVKELNYVCVCIFKL